MPNIPNSEKIRTKEDANAVSYMTPLEKEDLNIGFPLPVGSNVPDRRRRPPTLFQVPADWWEIKIGNEYPIEALGYNGDDEIVSGVANTYPEIVDLSLLEMNIVYLRDDEKPWTVMATYNREDAAINSLPEHVTRSDIVIISIEECEDYIERALGIIDGDKIPMLKYTETRSSPALVAYDFPDFSKITELFGITDREIYQRAKRIRNRILPQEEVWEDNEQKEFYENTKDLIDE